MKKPPTGEPYAGKPPVRFGGRGRRKPIPTPIGLHICSLIPPDPREVIRLAELHVVDAELRQRSAVAPPEQLDHQLMLAAR